MSLYINAVCDVEGCKVLQRFHFENDGETYGDLIHAMEVCGWVVRGALGDVRLECDKHHAQKAQS